MVAWGIRLLVIGLFSLLLPLFGRQFNVIMLLGLTGVGTALIGAVLAVVGAAMLFMNWVGENSPSPKPVSAAPVPQGAPSSVAVQPAVDDRFGRFRDGAGPWLTPYAFGLEIMDSALSEAASAIGALPATGHLFPAIKAEPGPAQARLAVLRCAAYFLVTDSACNGRNYVLDEMSRGFTDAIARSFGASPGEVESAYGLDPEHYFIPLGKDWKHSRDGSGQRDATATVLGAELVDSYRARLPAGEVATASELRLLATFAEVFGVQVMVSRYLGEVLRYREP